MRRTVKSTAVLSLAATLTLVGCSESTLPTAAEQATAFFTHAPAPGFEVSRRNVPLAEDVSVTAMIGPEGGRIDLARAGVTLLVPANAVDRPTEITVRALAGDALAFDLAPHGLELTEPASILVRISGTSLEESVGGLAGPLHNVIGVEYEEAGGAVEPLRRIPVESSKGSVVGLMMLLAGYATASG